MDDVKYSVRYSREDDAMQIEKLFYLSFGRIAEKGGALKNIENGRYLVAVNDRGDIIAATGLCHDDEYSGIQLSWTATDPKYRHNGIIRALISRLIASTDQDIYCCCWRVLGKEYANLHNALTMLGFTEVLHDMCKYTPEYKCMDMQTCPYWKKCNQCAQDLYLLKRS